MLTAFSAGLDLQLRLMRRNLLCTAASKIDMKIRITLLRALLLLTLAQFGLAQEQVAAASGAEPVLPYSPSLDLTSMDRSVDPCVDLYHYACGGWQKNNPIPADQTSWDVYAKLHQDNLVFLRGILEQASANDPGRSPVNQKIGDFYFACMDEAGAEKRGLTPLQAQLEAIAQLHSIATWRL